jgi:hypothetical protein
VPQVPVLLKVFPDEIAIYDVAARAAGKTRSSWIRDVLRAEIERTKKP